jgi:L-asparaginase II
LMSNFQGEVLAELVRNNLVESAHSGHLVALAADGSVTLTKGDTSLPIFPRSSVKSIQASAMVRAGLKLPPKLLALAASSHSGSKMHLDAVLEILAGAGLSESDLQNATDKPLGESERLHWGSAAPTRLSMNCSGKHAAMLATCVINGWDIKTYLQLDHPLQQAILKEIEALSNQSVANSTFDGCGAPLFAISTIGLAQAIRAITISTDPVHQEVIAACRQYPEMVAGEGRLTTRMMQGVPGLFMKDGAEGVNIASMPDGRTLVFKIADGSLRSFGVIIQAVLAGWGITTPEEKVNVYGGAAVVGCLEARIYA